MLIKNTITKNILEKIVFNTFSNFGEISSSLLLDSLKLLGFYYATISGLSIAIEDLRITEYKNVVFADTQEKIHNVNTLWQKGKISDIEYFQNILDNWSFVSEDLKNKVIYYYKSFDPLNNLYIMAFSGARGNISQVKQIIAMRGLMSDQEGNIINLVVKKNFFEGLNSIDYLISSYGARKGIVDTALKTANAGYLTRRLVYLCQGLIIRQVDCKTKTGLFVFISRNKKTDNLIGRTILSYKDRLTNISILLNKVIDPSLLDFLNYSKIKTILIRSSLTCESLDSICQKCYGFNLSQNMIISLGEVVGVVAAQAIGEPGTQLTMRTFHTGGVFSHEIVNQVLAINSGKLIIPSKLNIKRVRTNKGEIIYQILQETNFYLINWQGIKENFKVPNNSFINIPNSHFIKKGQVIYEISTKNIEITNAKIRPYLALFDGEILKKKIKSSYLQPIILHNKSLFKIIENSIHLSLNSGKIFIVPKEIKFIYKTCLKPEKSIGSLKFVLSFSSCCSINRDKISFLSRKSEFEFNCSSFRNFNKNFKLEIFPSIKTNQYIDIYTVFCFAYIFPNFKEKIYQIRHKVSNQFKIIFFITDSDVWKVYADDINNTFFFKKNQFFNFIDKEDYISSSLYSKISGFLLKKDGFRFIFQKCLPICLNKNTLINIKIGDFVFKNTILANAVIYNETTKDIVQGLPKVEELIDSIISENSADIVSRSGIFLENVTQSNVFIEICKEQFTLYFNSLKNQNIKKNLISIFSNIYQKHKTFFWNNKLWTLAKLPKNIKPSLNRTRSGNFYRFNYMDKIFTITEPRKIKKWNKINFLGKNFENRSIYSYINNFKNKKFFKVFDSIYIDKIKLFEDNTYKNRIIDSFIFMDRKDNFFYMKNVNLIKEYSLIKRNVTNIKFGQFLEIGTPITSGIIDLHNLLSVFYEYYLDLDGIYNGYIKSLRKFQLVLVNSIQGIYESQGVNINSKHIEIIVRQMTSKSIIIKTIKNSPLLHGEIIKFSFLMQLYKVSNNLKKRRFPTFKPLVLSSTKIALMADGFLSPAGFQETKSILAKSALEGNTDWLRGLKESVMIGKLNSTGSSFYIYKENLDNLYQYIKNK